MADLLESAVALSLNEAFILLKEQLAGICDNPAGTIDSLQGKRVLRLEIPLAGGNVDPLAFLQTCPCEEKFYWRDRDDNSEMAAIGETEKFILSSPEDFDSLFVAVQSRLAGLPESVRFWGGFRFDQKRSHPDKCWQSFGRGQLVLPRLEIHLRDDTCLLTCNILAEEIRDLCEAEYSRWFAIADSGDVLINPVDQIDTFATKLTVNRTRTDLPTRQAWEAKVTETTDLIATGKLDKLVLSRKSTIDMQAPVNPWEILGRLRESSQSCFLFGILPGKSSTFVGATPEQLYYRKGQHIISEAIAGTRSRGENSEQDARLADDLFTSEKDRREHQWVVDGIEQSLGHLCGDLTRDNEPTLLKLSRVQHLLTRFKGDLQPIVDDAERGVGETHTSVGDAHPSIGDAEILSFIHPTPAVGGFPRDQSIDRINQLEPFDRGWYAGPVGYVSSSSAQFAVAIRCALVSEESLSMFSGAGLVAGSDPGAEWREIEDKISNFLTVIGL